MLQRGTCENRAKGELVKDQVKSELEHSSSIFPVGYSVADLSDT